MHIQALRLYWNSAHTKLYWCMKIFIVWDPCTILFVKDLWFWCHVLHVVMSVQSELYYSAGTIECTPCAAGNYSRGQGDNPISSTKLKEALVCQDWVWELVCILSQLSCSFPCSFVNPDSIFYMAGPSEITCLSCTGGAWAWDVT